MRSRIAYDTIYSGEASNNTEVDLTSSVNNYQILIVVWKMNNDNKRILTFDIPVEMITATDIQFMQHISGSNTTYYNIGKISFPSNTKAKWISENGNWAAPKLLKILGVK